MSFPASVTLFANGGQLCEPAIITKGLPFAYEANETDFADAKSTNGMFEVSTSCPGNLTGGESRVRS